MVTVLVVCPMTGACHAPVDSRKEKAGKMQDGRLWIKRQCVGGLMAVKDALKRGSLWKTINEGRVTQ